MYLGLDVGTSGVKAVLSDEAGAVVAQHTAPLGAQRPRPGWSEQDPADWWRATQGAVLALDADARRAVRAVGLAGQMHGATLLDAQDRVLRPAILWNDGRSEAQCAELVRREPRTHAITGNAVFPGFTAPKLLWVAEHEPEVFAATARVLLPKDYVRMLMTGAAATDMSDASGTSWLDVGARAWSDDMLAATGLTRAAMPEAYEGSEATGTLLPEIAGAWGMEAVPVAAGGGDNAAGAIGAGVVSPGDAFLSLGTSGVIFAAGDGFAPNPERGVHAFCHALPGRWHEMTVMLSAAACVDWAARLVGAADAGGLVVLAEKARKASVPLFLPYLSGERTPHNDATARGVLFGMDHDTGPAEIARAVLEGVALGFADGLGVLSDAGATTRLAVIGGGSRSTLWGRILASALDRPLGYHEGAEVGPAYGAARLAALSVGGDPERVLAAPPLLSVSEPDPAMVTSLAEKRDRFARLYAQTRDLFQGAS